MGSHRHRVGLIAVAAILALVYTGCGSSSSSSTSSGTTAGRSAGAPPLGPAAKKVAAKTGPEASASELEEVSKVVEASQQAREEKDWAGQCATLSVKVKVTISQAPEAKKLRGCTAQLGAQGQKANAALLKDNMAGGVAEFRLESDQTGNAYYHGTDGKDWWVPLRKEGGEWKVAALLASEVTVPKAKKGG